MAKKLAFDKLLFASMAVLLMGGIVMVYSASVVNVDATRQSALSVNPFLKQILAAGVGLVAMAAGMLVDYRLLKKPAVVYGVVASVLALLVMVLFAPSVNNTNRWLFFGGVSVQPSELAKIAVVLFLAYQIDRKDGLVNERQALVPCLSVIAVFAVLILLQPDLGTMAIMAGVAGLMLYLAGLSWRYIAAAVAISLPALWFAIMSVPYRRQRMFTFLAPEEDPLGSGFQVLQSMIAVGSGGIRGLGLGQSVQKLHFLPFAESDFIFAILSEELGLLGSVGVVVLFMVFFWRGIRAGLKAPERFGRLLAWGLTSMIVLQALINVSVAVALLPTTGAPLPLISYGGSSLVATLLACGLVLNVSQHG
jgi:cell division protein FtsW